MIEIEAKIDMLEVFILGEPLSFSNQVLFFQRKSITDVVEILVDTGKLEMVFVGVTSFEIRGTSSHDQAWVPDGAHGRS